MEASRFQEEEEEEDILLQALNQHVKNERKRLRDEPGMEGREMEISTRSPVSSSIVREEITHPEREHISLLGTPSDGLGKIKRNYFTSRVKTFMEITQQDLFQKSPHYVRRNNESKMIWVNTRDRFYTGFNGTAWLDINRNARTSVRVYLVIVKTLDPVHPGEFMFKNIEEESKENMSIMKAYTPEDNILFQTCRYVSLDPVTQVGQRKNVSINFTGIGFLKPGQGLTMAIHVEPVSGTVLSTMDLEGKGKDKEGGRGSNVAFSIGISGKCVSRRR